MARRSRNYLPGFPYHVFQRGNNRATCFRDADDYYHYLSLWQRITKKYGLAVHAYCLMTNHIHFLVTPENADSISRSTKDIGSIYATYFNKRYDRTGTLWEGRHKSSIILTDNYLLTCYRYIELNPVRACIVSQPEDYLWSTFRINTREEACWIAPHPAFLSLGKTPKERSQNYKELTLEAISNKELNAIRNASHKSFPLGEPQHIEKIERQFGIRLGLPARGRPRLIKI